MVPGLADRDGIFLGRLTGFNKRVIVFWSLDESIHDRHCHRSQPAWSMKLLFIEKHKHYVNANTCLLALEVSDGARRD